MLWGAGIEVCRKACCLYYLCVQLNVKYIPFQKQTELFYKENPLFLNQVQYCEEHLVPYMIIVGSEEKEKGGVKIRNVKSKQEVC